MLHTAEDTHSFPLYSAINAGAFLTNIMFGFPPFGASATTVVLLSAPATLQTQLG